MQYKVEISDEVIGSLAEAEELAKLGFTFRPVNNYFRMYGEGSITIDTLEQLQAFIHKYGRIVLQDTLIEIYNGYRE